MPGRRSASITCLAALVLATHCTGANDSWIPATDLQRVKRSGGWREASFRRASTAHLATQDEGAWLEFTFHGTGVVLTLDAHGLPFARLGAENLGLLEVTVDDGPVQAIEPQTEDRDIVLAREMQNRAHRVRLQHRGTGAGRGARVAGFRILHGDEGQLSIPVHAESNRFLTDVRAIVSRQGRIIANRLVRNWMTGQCRIAGLPAGRSYELELIASGWQSLRIRDIEIVKGKETALPPVYLRRTRDSTAEGVEFPRMGNPAILRPGESFGTRVFLQGAPLGRVELRRRVGAAVISRRVTFDENKSLAYDGRAEGTITVPDDAPPGLYDLVWTLAAKGGQTERAAPRSVFVVAGFPQDPVFVTFGHMDTWGQEQAEYLELMADLSNLIAPDMVLVSNEVNAAYTSGAFSRLEMPHVVNFGNHEVAGHEEWYGNAVNMVDFGRDLAVLNVSHAWHGDISHAFALLESRVKTACKIINAFEHDAPVEDMLDRYRVPFLHEAHGPGPKVVQIGRTPTQRAGKVNSESFRVVRFKGCRPVSFTYAGAAEAPIPLPRHKPAPLRLRFSPANDGTHGTVTARVDNEWKQDFPNSRITFVMPKGDYVVNRGRIESAIHSDDGRFSVVSVRVDLPANSVVEVTAGREGADPRGTESKRRN